MGIMNYYVVLCTIMYFYALLCTFMYYYVLLCIIMCYYVLYYALSCIIMYYYNKIVLFCLQKRHRGWVRVILNIYKILFIKLVFRDSDFSSFCSIHGRWFVLQVIIK